MTLSMITVVDDEKYCGSKVNGSRDAALGSEVLE